MPIIQKKSEGTTMENRKKDSAFKTVLLIFGIIFSVVLVPGLIVGIPVGGAAVALSQSVSQEGLESMVKEAKLSENLHTMMMKELETEVSAVDELNPAFWNGLLENSLSVEFVDGLVAELVDCVYNGTEPQMDVGSVMDGFRGAISDISENGFDDVYSACFEGTESKYFSGEFVSSLKDEVESDLLGQYSDLGVTSLEDLKVAYDAQFGTGAYDTLWNEKIGELKAEWESEFLNEVDAEMDGIETDLEQEINGIISEAVYDEEVRSVFDMFKEISAKKDTVKLVAYGIILAAVLLLLACYWFGTAGFVVPSVALILGGLLCKLVTLLEKPFLNLVKAELATEPGVEEFEFVVTDLCKGIVTPFFDEMSKFGFTMVGIGILLILLAILKNVLAKNKQSVEGMM